MIFRDRGRVLGLLVCLVGRMSKMMREVEMGCREKVGVKRITLKTTRQTLALPTL